MPEWRAEIRRRIASLGLAPEREAEIAEELSQHLDDRYAERRAQGASEANAREDALREIGSAEALSARLGAVEAPAPAPRPAIGVEGGDHWTAHVLQDIRYGLRMLRARPLFTLVAVATLAIGIGANSAIFSVVDAVILRPLPYPEPDRLVTFWLTAPEKGLARLDLPPGLFSFYGARSRTLSGLDVYSSGGATLAENGDAERVNASAVSTGFFHTVGIAPALGRAFVAADGAKGAPGVAMISYRLWKQRFGGDPKLLGRSVDFSSEPSLIIGVMPPAFNFPDDADIWFPLEIDENAFTPWYLEAVGRMKAGVKVADVQREIESLTDEAMIRHPERFPFAKRGENRAVAMPLSRQLVGDARAPLLVLLGAVGLVLLIAAANIANLQLARAAARTREMAVRCCIGASPRQIAAQLLTESLLLALLGSAAGVALATWGMSLVRALPIDRVPRLASVHMDGRVLLFTFAVTLSVGVLFGLAPALRASRTDLHDALRDGTRAGRSSGSKRLMNGFVVSQFALSVILLVGAGLMLRSFQNLVAVDPGFRAENLLVTRVWLQRVHYPTDGRMRQVFDALVASVRALPGVRSAGMNDMVPFGKYDPHDEFTVEGQQPAQGEPVPVAEIRRVTPGYFETMGMPIIRGRDFLDTDTWKSPPIAIVDEMIADRYWPNADPIGKRIREGKDSTVQWLEIVGVTRTVRGSSLGERGEYALYRPNAQQPAGRSYLVVRTAGDPRALIAPVRKRLSELDPGLPMNETHTMEQAVSGSLAITRLTNVLLTGFALVALVLAAIGIYGVMSLGVAGRSHEFGVRLALGAAPSSVLALVLRQGMTLAGLGLAIGALGALVLTRFIASLLYGVAPADAVTFIVVVAALAGVAFAASYFPARRATKADPVSALRQD